MEPFSPEPDEIHPAPVEPQHHGSRRLWDGGRAILFFVFAALCSLLLGIVLLPLLKFYGSVVVAEIAGFALAPYLVSRLFDTGWSRWLSPPRVPPEFWVWSIVAVFAFAVTESNLPVLLDRLWPIPSSQFEFYRHYLAADSPWEWLLFVLVAAIIPGVCEEITFRGLVQTGLRRSFGPKQAIIWTGFLFAILHLNPWNFLGLWGFGCLLGYLTERTSSIWPAILVHVLNNALALVVFAFQSPAQWERPLEFLPWYATLPAGVFLVIAIWRIHRLRTDPPAPQANTIDRWADPTPPESP
ncbi:MAG: CPBP family intramembrane metalloprotease [candidate division Zixibacteria bacterium]|nr:CPBP family intramembrane metalloprotease [candidate division Zixibacteria bacterium]